MQSRALRDQVLRSEVDVAEVRASARTSWIVAWYWVATALVAWWTPWVIAAWIFASILGALLHRRERRRQLT
jgi:hypothetical protein